jgi:hypothetical protein
MADVHVRCDPDGSGWSCRVRVSEAGTVTEHRVTVTAADLARLDPGAATPDALVGRSFRFLLEREPKESILGAFDLTVIGRYFPEWEAALGRR